MQKKISIFFLLSLASCRAMQEGNNNENKKEWYDILGNFLNQDEELSHIDETLSPAIIESDCNKEIEPLAKRICPNSNVGKKKSRKNSVDKLFACYFKDCYVLLKSSRERLMHSWVHVKKDEKLVACCKLCSKRKQRDIKLPRLLDHIKQRHRNNTKANSYLSEVKQKISFKLFAEYIFPIYKTEIDDYFLAIVKREGIYAIEAEKRENFFVDNHEHLKKLNC